jgi:hypothetical protein
VQIHYAMISTGQPGILQLAKTKLITQVAQGCFIDDFGLSICQIAESNNDLLKRVSHVISDVTAVCCDCDRSCSA